MMRAVVAAAVSLVLCACAAGRAYEGPDRDSDELARIVGDPRITAGSPVTVILRKVDDYELGLNERSVDVLPGKHTLVVDCRIAETGSISRFSIDAEVYEGVSYRLVAETGPALRSCSEVRLERTGR
jgi:hypothetical protein